VHRTTVYLITALTVIGSLTACAVSASLSSRHPATTASFPAAQASRDACAIPALPSAAPSLAPVSLDTIVNALENQGTGPFADTYSTIAVNVPHNQVILYATNATLAAKLIAAAKRADPSIDTTQVCYMHANFTLVAIKAAIATIMAAYKSASASDLILYSAGQAPDGGSIQVTAKASAVTRLRAELARLITQKTGIPVTVTAGAPFRG
jgi:hypothetical protein